MYVAGEPLNARDGILNAIALILEDVTRASILLVMYAIFETKANPAQTVSLSAFFADTSHQFIGLVTVCWA